MARTQGIALLERLHDGDLTVTPSEYLDKTREEVSIALEELIEVGARIRPLFIENKRVGWVRGVHLSERKAMKRWITDEGEYVEHLLRLGTTLSTETIQGLSLVEVRSLARVIAAMTDSDLRLYAYVSAFVTTSMSEQIWFSRGTDATNFRGRTVSLPDGAVMQVALPSDQARLWATLCNYRMHAKVRLEASMNAVLTIRPAVGKGADGLANELKAVARGLITDNLDPWREIVQVKASVNINDGWAHTGDDSKEALVRELNSMMANDRHEQVFDELAKQQQRQAEKKAEEVAARLEARGGKGFYEFSATPMTPQQVLDYDRGVRPSSPPVEEEQPSPLKRLPKYK